MQKPYPVHLIAFAIFPIVALLAKNIDRNKGLFNAIRIDASMVMIFFLVLHTTIAGMFFELGENTRFKFLIEPIFWVFLVTLFYRLLDQLMRRLRQ